MEQPWLPVYNYLVFPCCPNRHIQNHVYCPPPCQSIFMLICSHRAYFGNNYYSHWMFLIPEELKGEETHQENAALCVFQWQPNLFLISLWVTATLRTRTMSSRLKSHPLSNSMMSPSLQMHSYHLGVVSESWLFSPTSIIISPILNAERSIILKLLLNDFQRKHKLTKAQTIDAMLCRTIQSLFFVTLNGMLEILCLL